MNPRTKMGNFVDQQPVTQVAEGTSQAAVISISKFSSHLDFVGKKEASPTKQPASTRDDVKVSTAEYVEIEKVANQVRNMQNYKVSRKSTKRRHE